MGRLYGSFLPRILLEINSLKICNYYISTQIWKCGPHKEKDRSPVEESMLILTAFLNRLHN